jgi:hypothetical protein
MNLSEKLAKMYPEHTPEGRKNGLINLDDTSFWSPEKQGVTQSVLGMFSMCPQKAHLKMRVGIAPASFSGVGAMEFGDFFHRGLDSLYLLLRNGVDKDLVSDNLEAIVDDIVHLLYLENKNKLIEQVARPSLHTELEIMAGTCQTLLQHYFRRWITDFQDFDWVDLEKTFNVPYELDLSHTFANGSYMENKVTIPLRGKYDGVFRDVNGRLWLFETKTKSYIDDTSIIDKLNYDLQVMMYMLTMKKVYGETPAGVVYNVVKRPLLRQKVKESLPEFLERIGDDILGRQDDYFIRYTATITPDELQKWEDTDFKSLISRIYKWSKGEDNYKNSAACHMFNRPCEYMKVCAYGDTTFMQKKENLFPELETPNEAVKIETDKLASLNSVTMLKLRNEPEAAK